jgi:hypothetical protein
MLRFLVGPVKVIAGYACCKCSWVHCTLVVLGSIHIIVVSIGNSGTSDGGILCYFRCAQMSRGSITAVIDGANW